MEAFELAALQTRHREAGDLYLEFLRVEDLSLGLYVLAAGSEDPQQPHAEDEVYLVTSGRAMVDVDGEQRAVGAGSIVYVPAGVPHFFHNIEEELAILVFFAPAESKAGERTVTESIASRQQYGDYEISNDPRRLDVEMIHRYLSQDSYWAQGRSRETVVRSINHSLCFGVYQGSEQVAFARVITDYAVRAYIADVFVLPAHRGKGLAKWLVACILAHPLLEGVTRLALDTRDAHGLYEQFGFEVAESGRHMGLRR